jgi:hypothetical protein
MKCPHCLDSFHPELKEIELGNDKDRDWRLRYQKCPACAKFIFILCYRSGGSGWNLLLVYPKAISRTPLSTDVPDKFANDYKEACLVIADSPKASAALSRRCLQNILREEAKVKPQDLSKEIEEVLSSGKLPSHLAERIDVVRNIGNFAAHPIKSTNTGEIVDVEPGEAEWLLDILEGLFDFYFVQTAILKRKKDDLNKKLTDAGKPPMK